MRSRRSRNGTYFRTDAVIRFLARQPEGHTYSAFGVAESIQDVDPGCTRHQAKHALEIAMRDGHVEIAPHTIGRCNSYRATSRGRRYR